MNRTLALDLQPPCSARQVIQREASKFGIASLKSCSTLAPKIDLIPDGLIDYAPSFSPYGPNRRKNQISGHARRGFATRTPNLSGNPQGTDESGIVSPKRAQNIDEHPAHRRFEVHVPR